MSAVYDKPIPKISPESEPFWAALRQHKLLLQRCGKCGRTRHYPRLICDACYCSEVDWIEASGRGRLYSWTVAHHAFLPGFKPDLPYILAIADLEEGVRVQAQLHKALDKDLRLGMPVRAVFEDATPDLTLLGLEPDIAQHTYDNQ